MTGARTVNVGREEVENGEKLLSAAETGMAVLVAGGESMSATTHMSLRIEAAGRGIKTRVVFGPSIFTAAAAILGLHQYKFGRTVTIPRFQKGYRPLSPFITLNSNAGAGVHTLALLDVDSEHGYFMAPGEAFTEMLEVGQELGKRSIDGTAVACTVSRAGLASCETHAGRIGRLKGMDFGAPPHCIVIPGRLHFQEAEALKLFSGALDEELSAITD